MVAEAISKKKNLIHYKTHSNVATVSQLWEEEKEKFPFFTQIEHQMYTMNEIHLPKSVAMAMNLSLQWKFF